MKTHMTDTPDSNWSSAEDDRVYIDSEHGDREWRIARGRSCYGSSPEGIRLQQGCLPWGWVCYVAKDVTVEDILALSEDSFGASYNNLSLMMRSENAKRAVKRVKKIEREEAEKLVAAVRELATKRPLID